MANDQVSPFRKAAEDAAREILYPDGKPLEGYGDADVSEVAAIILRHQEAACSQTVAPGQHSKSTCRHCGFEIEFISERWVKVATDGIYCDKHLNPIAAHGFGLHEPAAPPAVSTPPQIAQYAEFDMQVLDAIRMRAEEGKAIHWNDFLYVMRGLLAGAVSTPRILRPFRGDGTGGELEAIEAALRFIDETVSERRCDAEAVSECVRCTAVYLANIVKQLKNAAVSTPRCPPVEEIASVIYERQFDVRWAETQGIERALYLEVAEAVIRQFFQPDSQPSPGFSDGLEAAAQLIERICSDCDCKHAEVYAREIRKKKAQPSPEGERK